jgi:3-oxoacyl-[acyl-carrier protein] reductase
MRRFANLDEVAGAVAFVAGPDAAYMTGSFITVDGGAATALGLGRSM